MECEFCGRFYGKTSKMDGNSYIQGIQTRNKVDMRELICEEIPKNEYKHGKINYFPLITFT